ncbi:MAG: damage-control phosphatase ARMT1 family protein [Candidatus Ranarchaeia archaeon]
MDEILVYPECATCIISTIEKMFQVSDIPREIAIKKIQKILDKLGKRFCSSVSAIDLANELFTYTIAEIGIDDPFIEIKRKSNTFFNRIKPELEKKIQRIKDPKKEILACIKLSLIGNNIDVGTEGHVFDFSKLEKEFLNYNKLRLEIDDSIELINKVKSGTKILFLADNAGEIGFDTILINALRKKGSKITLVVKGKPISNDATIEDALEVGASEKVDKIITTGIGKLGAPFNEISKELIKEFNDSEIIISKGQSNFETMINYANKMKKEKSIFLILKTKCEFIAKELDVPKNSYVLKLVK